MYLWLDQFNELIPSHSDAEYLFECGKTQWESLQLWEYVADPQIEITWVVQGWMFVNERRFWTNYRIAAYLGGVNADDILILDLIAEKKSIATESDEFYGHCYIWCFLHNFGGNHYLGGNLENVFYQLSLNEQRLETEERGHFLKGIGITMEGITNNEVLYEAVLSHSFTINDDGNNGALDSIQFQLESESEMESNGNAMTQFVDQYVASRYGAMINEFGGRQLMDLYHEFISIVYRSHHEKWGVTRSLMVMRPSMTLIEEDVIDVVLSGTSFVIRDASTLERRWRINQFQSNYIDYNFCALFQVWRRWMNLIESASGDSKERKFLALSPLFSNDMAEMTRQILSDFFVQCYALWKWWWIENEYEASRETVFLEKVMLDIIEDTDLLMSYFEHYRLDKWIRDARSFGENEAERDYMEMNARNLLTRWGPNAEITEYASREWNGLMLNYYYPRWKLFFDGATEDEIEQFEVQWQYQSIDLLEIDNRLQERGSNFTAFYETLHVLYTKYDTLIDCAVDSNSAFSEPSKEQKRQKVQEFMRNEQDSADFDVDDEDFEEFVY